MDDNEKDDEKIEPDVLEKLINLWNECNDEERRELVAEAKRIYGSRRIICN